MLLQKKQRNVYYNFFESLYSVAHFKCKGYILYWKLLLQWAVRKKEISRVPNLKKLYLEIFKYYIKKKRVDYFRSKETKKDISSKKKFWLWISHEMTHIYIYDAPYRHLG